MRRGKIPKEHLASPSGRGAEATAEAERAGLRITPSQTKIYDFCQLPQRGSQGVCSLAMTEKSGGNLPWK